MYIVKSSTQQSIAVIVLFKIDISICHRFLHTQKLCRKKIYLRQSTQNSRQEICWYLSIYIAVKTSIGAVNYEYPSNTYGNVCFFQVDTQLMASVQVFRYDFSVCKMIFHENCSLVFFPLEWHRCGFFTLHETMNFQENNVNI